MQRGKPLSTAIVKDGEKDLTSGLTTTFAVEFNTPLVGRQGELIAGHVSFETKG
jgi:hypothetical protein